jgi:trehalose/maltose hydrolase-like predicted phosphorylase
VTPRSRRAHDGRIVPVLTGDYEEHITADIAWATWHYRQWSGDDAFLTGPGASLLVEPARYWASRVQFDGSGRAHINRVEGPDEYHVPVDDNAFTNVMARWTLRRASELILGSGEESDETQSWQRIADAMVDGYVARTAIYEQFAGFFTLEPLIIAKIARPPVAADVLLPPERLAGSQVIKQADVLMLHHLVPEEVTPGSLVSNLDYYGPRTAHGSSLSPPIQASLLARAGRCDEALALLRIALRIDLDDLTGTTAGGLHLATFGGVWQALAYGFLGLWPSAGELRIDPHLPLAWNALEMTVRFRDARVRVRAEHDRLVVTTGGALTINLSNTLNATIEGEACFGRTPDGWRRK